MCRMHECRERMDAQERSFPMLRSKGFLFAVEKKMNSPKTDPSFTALGTPLRGIHHIQARESITPHCPELDFLTTILAANTNGQNRTASVKLIRLI